MKNVTPPDAAGPSPNERAGRAPRRRRVPGRRRGVPGRPAGARVQRAERGRPIRVAVVPDGGRSRAPGPGRRRTASRRSSGWPLTAASTWSPRRSRSWVGRRAADAGSRPSWPAADVIHFPGGDPDLIPTLMPGTRGLGRDHATRTLAGAVLAGASAGAMALGPWTWTPRRRDGRADRSSAGSWSCPTRRRRRGTDSRTLRRVGARRARRARPGRADRRHRGARRPRPARPSTGASSVRARRAGSRRRGWRRAGRRPRRRRIATPVIAAVRPDLGWRLDPDGHVPEPRLVRRLPGAGPRGPAGLARSPRVRAGALPVRRAAGPARRRRGRGRSRSLARIPRASPSCPTPRPASNTVLRSLRFEPGDELLTNDHEYNATINAMRAVADARRGTGRRRADPLPDRRPDEALAAILAAVTERTRLLLVSHVTSPTALILPGRRARRRARPARHRHARRRRPRTRAWCRVDVDALGAAYWTGNGHKWLCGPKGTAVLWVREDRRERIHPLGRVARRQRARSPDRTALPPRVRLGRHQRSDRLPDAPRGDRLDGSLRGPGRGRLAGGHGRQPCARARGSGHRRGRRSASRHRRPDAMLGSMAALPLARASRTRRRRRRWVRRSSRRTGSRSRSARWPVRRPSETGTRRGSFSASPPSATTNPPTTSVWRTRWYDGCGAN